MSKAKKSSKVNEKQLIEEYNQLMSTGTLKTSISQEWTEKGDNIEKFTMYGSYTPVKTSSGTGKIF